MLTLYHDGKISLYLYEEKGTKLRKEESRSTRKTAAGRSWLVMKMMRICRMQRTLHY